MITTSQTQKLGWQYYIEAQLYSKDLPRSYNMIF